MTNYGYAKEKLGLAIHTLATSPKDVRSRLYWAFMIFYTLKISDFPKELQNDWEWIYNQLTKYKPKNAYEKKYLGAIGSTLHHIRNSTGEKIAERLYELNWKLQEY